MRMSKLHSCGGSEARIIVAREFIMRSSEPKPHWINKFAGVLSIPKFETRLRNMIRTSESGH